MRLPVLLFRLESSVDEPTDEKTGNKDDCQKSSMTVEFCLVVSGSKKIQKKIKTDKTESN